MNPDNQSIKGVSLSLTKVNRCLARYSLCATTTNQPTNRASNEPARPICAQESIFWAKVGSFWAKNLIFYRRKQGTLVTLFFGQAWDQMGLKCQYLAQMPVLGQIWPFLGPKSNFLGAGSKNFGTLVSGFQ